MDEAKWQITKSMIEMEHLESYFAKLDEVSGGEVVLEVVFTKWGGR